MPFDRFTIEQLAGDLLPSATLEQRVATGFNRCNVYHQRRRLDRRRVPGALRSRSRRDHFDGLDRPDDGLLRMPRPQVRSDLTQKEFYQLYAFFNSMADGAMDGNALAAAADHQSSLGRSRKRSRNR